MLFLTPNQQCQSTEGKVKAMKAFSVPENGTKTNRLHFGGEYDLSSAYHVSFLDGRSQCRREDGRQVGNIDHFDLHTLKAGWCSRQSRLLSHTHRQDKSQPSQTNRAWRRASRPWCYKQKWTLSVINRRRSSVELTTTTILRPFFRDQLRVSR